MYFLLFPYFLHHKATVNETKVQFVWNDSILWLACSQYSSMWFIMSWRGVDYEQCIGNIVFISKRKGKISNTTQSILFIFSPIEDQVIFVFSPGKPKITETCFLHWCEVGNSLCFFFLLWLLRLDSVSSYLLTSYLQSVGSEQRRGVGPQDREPFCDEAAQTVWY